MNRSLPFLFLLLALATSCAPASMPAPASTASISPAVAMIDNFYTVINTAQTRDDLVVLWNTLTFEAQCIPVFKGCTLDGFQDRLWQAKLLYRLYDCGPDFVVAEELRYPRGEAAPITPAGSKFWAYSLVETDEGLLISDISFTPAPGEGCTLVIDRFSLP